MKNGKPSGSRTKPKKATARASRPVAKTKSSAATNKPDPRKVPPPTAPASVAAKAAEAIAPIGEVAIAEPKKAEPPKPTERLPAANGAAKETAKPAANGGPATRTVATPVRSAAQDRVVETTRAAEKTAESATSPVIAAFNIGRDQARAASAAAVGTGDELRKAVAESTTSTARGLFELNGKVVELWQAQSDAAFDLWRATLSAGSLSEAVRVQTKGFRQSYEAAASHWKDVAETAGRVVSEAAKSFQSALTQAR